MPKKTHINTGKRIYGARVVEYCNKCKRDLVKGKCYLENVAASRCEFADTHHVIKVILHKPGTKNERITKILKGVKNMDEANRVALEMKRDLREGFIEPREKQIAVNIKVEKQPKLLKYAMAEFMGYLNNENVPPHLQRERSPEYIKSIALTMKVLGACLKKSGHDLNIFPVNGINDSIVGHIHDFLLSELKFSSRNYNKYIFSYGAFMRWMEEQGYDGVKDYFAKVPRKQINPQPEALEGGQEFESLLEQITKENGIKLTPGKKVKVRNLYRDWLADGFRLALETGRRREEIINIKLSDIVEINNSPAYIKVEDRKVNRIRNLKNFDRKFVFVPISKNLNVLINKLGYLDYKNNKTDRFLLAPDVQDKRNRVMSDLLSRGFAHFYEKLNNGKQLSFGALRKTYITSMDLHTTWKGNGNVKDVSGHSGDAVLRHYIDPKIIASVRTARGFEVFPNENNDRVGELKQTRKKTVKQSKTIER